MLIGLGFLAFASAFHLFGARTTAGEGYGRQLPAASSASSTRLSRQVRRAQTAGWGLVPLVRCAFQAPIGVQSRCWPEVWR